MYKQSTINHLYPRMNQIIPNLFLGDIESATDLESLTEHKIKHIVSVLARDQFLVPLQSHVLIKLTDGNPYTQAQLNEGFKFIKDAIDNKEGVLVHCMAGISRSSALVGAYLMKELGYSPVKTINFMHQQREIVDPAYFTYQSVIKWVYPNYKMICTNTGCGKAWDYRETYEFINYALRTEDQNGDNGSNISKLEKFPKDCLCDDPKVEVISN